MEFDKILDLCEELEEYSDFEGSEIGEACQGLIQLAHFGDYVSDKFYESLIEEIKTQLDMFKKNSKIVEKEVTITMKEKSLEWFD